MLQYNLAAHELMQIGRQILTSLIAEQIAHHEYLNIQQQIANAQEVDQFLHDKFTNEDLYLWMQGEISRLYYEYYRFAFDTARRAEKTMKQELMRPEVDAQDFVKFNYWDGGRKGLLSGEALYLDVKRMELAYHDNNKRELELTRHVSLRQLDPARPAHAQGDRHVPGDDSRMAVRPRLSRSLYAPHQERRPFDTVRRWAVHQRQLHSLALEEQLAQVSYTEGQRIRTTRCGR